MPEEQRAGRVEIAAKITETDGVSGATKSEAICRKKAKLLTVCSQGDVSKLRQMADVEHGLVDDDVRRLAWPLLLGVNANMRPHETDWEHLATHRDEEQVHLDVHRSFVYYPKDETDDEKDFHKRELNSVITAILRRHPMLHYFQGYHDIVQVLLLVLGAKECVPSVERLSLLRIRDFMLPTMSGTEHHLRLLPAILYAADAQVCEHLSQTQPFFALAATLTLYAHDIEEYGDIARLFDFLLANEAIMSLYLFAVIVVSRKSQLLEIEPNEPEMLHAILSKLPKPLDLEGLIRSTLELYTNNPPEQLPNRTWWRVSSNSVLKTTHEWDKLQGQSLTDGERFFTFEASEIRRADMRKKQWQAVQRLARRYQKPVAYTGAAVLIAMLAALARNRDTQALIFGASPAIRRVTDLLRSAVSIIVARVSS